jgi:hypothetical protein
MNPLQFDGLGGLVDHLTRASMVVDHNLHIGLEQVCWIIEDDAKALVGEYQPQVGPFPAWAQLADATKADRVQKGFPANEPLLRTGEMRDSITHEIVSSTEAIVGSKSKIMRYQEFGTDRIPPRPVIGPAAWKRRDLIREQLGAAIMSGLMGVMTVNIRPPKP